MARISTYIIDQPVDADDKWIGTEFGVGTTKNFTARGVASFLNSSSSIAGQTNFFFQTNLNPGRQKGSISFLNGGGVNTPFSSLTSIKVSKYSYSDKLIAEYLQSMIGLNIFISQTDDINNFGIYKLNSLTQDPVELDFLNASLDLIDSNGALLLDKFYTFAPYSTNGASGTVTSISTSSPLTGGTITTSGIIGITQADAITDGYLSLADWNTFTNKENSANKQNSLAVDGTGIKFPTVDAVNAGITNSNYWTKTGNDIKNNTTGGVVKVQGGTGGYYDNAFQTVQSNGTVGFSVQNGGNVVCAYLYPSNIQFASGGSLFIGGGGPNGPYLSGIGGSYGATGTAYWKSNIKIKYTEDLSASYDDRTLVDKGYITTYTTAQLAGKMNNPSLTASYIPKALTATTIGNSRLLDTGTYLGIDTVNAPTKDITLGNQANREIGIEESLSVVVGRDLKVSAGRTTDYTNSQFSFVTALGVSIHDTAAVGNDVYVMSGSNIYKRTGESGNFVLIQTLPWGGNGNSLATAPNGDLYAAGGYYGGDIYKLPFGGTTFSAIGSGGTQWGGITVAPDSSVYVIKNSQIYKQSLGTGPFVSLNQISRSWTRLKAHKNGNIYATVSFGGLYMQTGGVGDFENIIPGSVEYGSMLGTSNNDFYLTGGPNYTILYKQTAGTGPFTSQYTGPSSILALSQTANGNIYSNITTSTGAIYVKLNDDKGTPNLQGGTLKLNSGTGKGTGASDIELYTGQVLSSGTDMQTSTLRAKINNEGLMTLPSVTNALIEAETTGKAVVTKEYLTNVVGSQNLQQVTNLGATTTNSITANSFIKNGGTDVQILAANGGIITAGTNITISGGTISSTGSSTPSLQQVLDFDRSLVSGKNAQGTFAGVGALLATQHNFFGSSAGYASTSASSSNFFGESCGFYAPFAHHSNFMGSGAGYTADNASNSNFLGDTAGYDAKNAENSNFFGYRSGYLATGASFSNLFGYNVGNNQYSSSLGSNNIIIGTNISLPSSAANSINIGGILFGTGTYSDVEAEAASITPVSGGKIGIGVVSPSTKLHVYSDTINTSGLRLERLTSASPTSTGQAIGVDANGNVVTVTSGGGGGGNIPHATASGTDTYTATISGVTSYSDGDAYLIRFAIGNTAVCTLNINGLGAIPLYRNNDGALIGGDVQDNGEMLCVYNSTANTFQCIGTSPNSIISYITNAESLTITKGQVVYAFGGTGDRMTVKLASNIGDSTSAQTVGIVLSTSIAANQKGFIMFQGLLDNLSTLPTTTWADGDPVYLGSTAGSITKIKPYAPNHLVYIGIVTTASSGNAGRMYVRVQNGYELDELHNVQAQNPNNKDTLYYDDTVTPKQWKTSSISGILGYTPADDSTVVHKTGNLSETIDGFKTFTNVVTAHSYNYSGGSIFSLGYTNTFYTNGTGYSHIFGGGPGAVQNNVAIPLGVLSVGANFITPLVFGLAPSASISKAGGGVLDLYNSSSASAGMSSGILQFSAAEYTNANIRSITSSAPGSGSPGGGNLIFSVSSNSTASIPSEVMRINDLGYLGIGVSNPTNRLEVLSSANTAKITSSQGIALDVIGGNNSNAIAKFTNVATSAETGRFDITGLKLPLETASTIAGFDANKNIKSLTTANGYPSLAQLQYVSGVTSSIQTQFSGKQATLVSGSNIKTINGSTILGSGDLIIGGTGITSLNGLNAPTQTFATSVGGSSFEVTSSGSTHTINIPEASYVTGGFISNSTQTIWGSKTFTNTAIFNNTVSTVTPGNGSTPDVILANSVAGGTLDLRKTINYTGGSGIGLIQFSGETPSSGTYALAAINAIAVTDPTSGNSGGGILSFKTTPAGNGGSPTERLRITKDGFVGIGTANPAYKLDVYNTGNCMNIDSSFGVGLRVRGGDATTTIPTAVFTNASTANDIVKIDYQGLKLSLETTSTIASFDANKNIKSLLPADGYPTLEELKVLKGEKDVAEQVLSNAGITHVGTSLPSGTANHSYRWSQLGNLVTVRINLSYTTTGTCSAIIIPFANLPDIPQQPQHPSIYSAVGHVITYGSGSLNANANLPTFTTGSGTSAIRIKSLGTPNTYEFAIGRASAAYLNGWAQIQYYVN